MWSRVLAATALLTLPACLNIPAFSAPADAPSGDDDDTPATSVNLTTDNGGHTATGPDFSVHFPGDGYQFPDQITHAGQALLSSARSSCDQPGGGGIALSPSSNVDGFADPKDGSTIFTVLANGPSLVEVDLAWHAPTDCMDAKGLSGHSIFAIMPDRRIVRFDAIDPPQDLLNAQACSCGAAAATNWSLRSELDVTFPLFPTIVNSKREPVQISETAPQDQVMCASGPGHSIGFGFQRDQVRVRQVDPIGVSFTYDFLTAPGGILDPGKMIDASSTAYLLGSDADCDTSIAKLQAFGNDPPLLVNGAAQGTGVDGVYAGNDGSGHPVVQKASTTTTLRSGAGTIPAGFVVWLELGVPNLTVTATSPKQTGSDWFTVGKPATPDGASQVLIWFRDALGPGDEITVTAAP